MNKSIHAAALALLAAGAPFAASGDEDGGVVLSRMVGAREQMLAAFDAMPGPMLQEFFLRCNGQASVARLELSDAVACAMASDALLKRQFAGDYGALLAWWRVHRKDVSSP